MAVNYAVTRVSDIAFTDAPYGITTAYATVRPEYAKYKADFLRVLHKLSSEADDEPTVLAAELQSIGVNTRFVTNEMTCFSDEVQPIEFPEFIAISVAAITSRRHLILVVLQKFHLANGNICFFFLGTRFVTDIELQMEMPKDNAYIYVSPKTLKPISRVVRDFRVWQQKQGVETGAGDGAADVTASPEISSMPMHTPSEIVDMLLSNSQNDAPETEIEPGGFILCDTNACNSVADSALPAYREQILNWVTRRLEYYKYPSTKVNRFTEGLLTTTFRGTHAIDLTYEYFGLMVIIVLMRGNLQYVIDRELMLMLLRTHTQLTNPVTRRQFLEINTLLEVFEQHQMVCTHPKYSCFEKFILETYEATLRHMGRLAHFLLYGVTDDQLRVEDEQTIKVLSELVCGAEARMREIFKTPASQSQNESRDVAHR